MDDRYFYGIRALAAEGLASCAGPDMDYIGFFHLDKAFNTLYCFPDQLLPRPNNFSNRPTYFVQLAMIRAMASIHDRSGHLLPALQKFYSHKLQYNDNGDNPISDCYYVSSLLLGLTQVLVLSTRASLDSHAGQRFEGRSHLEPLNFLLNEIERYRRIDEWMPSYRNQYSIATMECLKRLSLHDIIPRRGADFLQYTHPSNSASIRVKAFECLIELGYISVSSVFSQILSWFRLEASPSIRAKLWDLLESGLSQLTCSENSIPLQSTQIATINEQTGDSPSVHLRCAGLKTLFEGNSAAREALILTLRSRQLSLREYTMLLDLCAILFDPVDSLIVRVPYPRHWTCRHLGGGMIALTRNGTPRILLSEQLALTYQPLSVAGGNLVPPQQICEIETSVDASSIHVSPCLLFIFSRPLLFLI